MRIFYFSYEGFKKIRKLNNHIRETTSWFSRLGNEVHFFNPNIIQPEFDEPIELHLIPLINLPIIKWLTFDIFAFLHLLYNSILRRPNVIYYRESSSLVPLIISKLLSIPLVIEVNGWVLDELSAYGYPKSKLRLIRLLQGLNYHYASLLIPVSEGLKKLICQHYAVPQTKVFAVNNGTNPSKYYPVPIREARQKIGVDPQRQVIGFIGGCYPHHGIQYLINAAPFILADFPEIQFIVAGDGAMLNQWKELAKTSDVYKDFLFPGNVPLELAPYYINSFDICVSPWDINLVGSPMKLFDYMACGRPIVSSPVYGVKEILELHDAGLTVDVRNPNEFADAIKTLLNSPNLCSDMGQKARKLVLSQFTWEHTSRRIIELLLRTYEQRKKPRPKDGALL